MKSLLPNYSNYNKLDDGILIIVGNVYEEVLSLTNSKICIIGIPSIFKLLFIIFSSKQSEIWLFSTNAKSDYGSNNMNEFHQILNYISIHYNKHVHIFYGDAVNNIINQHKINNQNYCSLFHFVNVQNYTMAVEWLENIKYQYYHNTMQNIEENLLVNNIFKNIKIIFEIDIILSEFNNITTINNNKDNNSITKFESCLESVFYPLSCLNHDLETINYKLNNNKKHNNNNYHYTNNYSETNKIVSWSMQSYWAKYSSFKMIVDAQGFTAREFIFYDLANVVTQVLVGKFFYEKIEENEIKKKNVINFANRDDDNGDVENSNLQHEKFNNITTITNSTYNSNTENDLKKLIIIITYTSRLLSDNAYGLNLALKSLSYESEVVVDINVEYIDEINKKMELFKNLVYLQIAVGPTDPTLFIENFVVLNFEQSWSVFYTGLFYCYYYCLYIVLI
jgi:hypothetical protein